MIFWSIYLYIRNSSGLPSLSELTHLHAGFGIVIATPTWTNLVQKFSSPYQRFEVHQGKLAHICYKL
jgi:hypothetical protein